MDMSALRPLTEEEVEREAYRARMQVPTSRVGIKRFFNSTTGQGRKEPIHRGPR